MAAVGKAVQLWNEWELHLLVLLSFILQVFLFFTGSLRRQSNNTFLRLCIWAAYLAADGVPIYTLGFLSRKEAPTEGGALGGIPPLTMIWLSFLLVHLGGPDNITAYAIADNNLWVRHFLSLGLQVILALYIVIGKSAGWHDRDLLMPCIFVFVVGIIKYGERTMALKNANLKSQKGIADIDEDMDNDGKDSRAVSNALRSMPGVYHLFSGHAITDFDESYFELCQLHSNEVYSHDQSIMKTLEIELGMVYDDLYTKATVLRTKTGVFLRCTIVVSTIVAFVLFLARKKQSYRNADVVITYMLFIGGICMEIWALFMILLSPWTWLWLKNQRFRWLASVSMRLLLSRLGLSKERILWSNSMGQYDLASALGYDNASRTSWKLGVIRMIRAVVRLVGVGKGATLWFSNLLAIRYVKVDNEIIECLSKEVQHLSKYKDEPFCFPNLRPLLLGQIRRAFLTDFGASIITLHAFTQFHLRRYPAASAPAGMDGRSPVEAKNDRDNKVRRLAEVCGKLSRYMLYIKMTYQEMFPADAAMETSLNSVMDFVYGDGKCSDAMSCMEKIMEPLDLPEPKVCVETLEEIQRMWIRIIMYAAGKSRAEMHAAQLAGGGELLTFVWLLMLHHRLGDLNRHRLELFAPEADVDMYPARYAFNPTVSPP